MNSESPVVAHLSTVHTWNDTRIFQRMCKSLARKGFDVHFIVPCNDWDQPQEIDGVTIHPLPRTAGRLGRATVSAYRVFRTTRKLRADICHFHDPELMWIGILLRLYGHRVIYDVHEDFVGDVVEKSWIPRPLRRTVGWLVSSLEAVVARVVSGVVTAGSDIQQRLGRHTDNCISVQNYPDLNAFPKLTNATEAEPPQVVFLGGMNRTEVPQSLIRAIELIPSDLEFEFVWGGKRSDPEVLAGLRKRRGWSRVKFLDFVPFAKVNELMRHARAAVVLYADAPNNYSIRSNRLFETMAVSLPIIGPSYGDWTAFLQQHACGLPVDPHSPQEIATAIERVLRNREEAHDMGAAGRTAVEREFNWASELDRLVQLYRKLLA